MGIGGATYAYLQTEDGKKQSEKWFTWVDEFLGVTPSAPKINKIKENLRAETKGSISSSPVKAPVKSEPAPAAPSSTPADKPLVSQSSNE